MEGFYGPPLPCLGEVILHASADLVCRWVGPSTVVEPLGPDRCRVVASSWSWTGLAAWAGLFDADIEIVGPPELHAAADPAIRPLRPRHARHGG